jgi:hypothetical protein
MDTSSVRGVEAWILDPYLRKDGMVGNDVALGDRKAALTGTHLNSVIDDT